MTICWSTRDEAVIEPRRTVLLSTERPDRHLTVFKTKMAPKRRTRASTRAADSSSTDDVTPSDDHTGEEVEVKKTIRGKRSAPDSSEKSKKAKAKEPPSIPLFSHWLMKSEPESRLENGIDVKFGIEDLKALPNQTGCWDGVRNYQARNFMRDMREGHVAFFYHSNCKEPGIAGCMEIVKEAYVDHTQFDKKDVHFDASSKADNPKWSMVDVRYQRMLQRFIPLAELKKYHLQHSAGGGPLNEHGSVHQGQALHPAPDPGGVSVHLRLGD